MCLQNCLFEGITLFGLVISSAWIDSDQSPCQMKCLQPWGWREGSEVPVLPALVEDRLDPSTHSSTSSVPPVQGHLMPLLTLLGSCPQVVHRSTVRWAHTHTHTRNFSPSYWVREGSTFIIVLRELSFKYLSHNNDHLFVGSLYLDIYTRFYLIQCSFRHWDENLKEVKHKHI